MFQHAVHRRQFTKKMEEEQGDKEGRRKGKGETDNQNFHTTSLSSLGEALDSRLRGNDRLGELPLALNDHAEAWIWMVAVVLTRASLASRTASAMALGVI